MTHTYSIAQVAEETGLAKEVLRKWEQRYGFPAPQRNGNGERAYPADQVQRLHLIRKLIDAGLRPAKIVALDQSALLSLSQMYLIAAAPASADEAGCGALIELLTGHDVTALRTMLRSTLQTSGLQRFVEFFLPAWNHAVGEAWRTGTIAIHAEHLYTETVQRLLRETISHGGHAPGDKLVLLTTPSGESHLLGILMAEALLTQHGARCVALGAETPIEEIVMAAAGYRAQVVALSFSISYPARRVSTVLVELRSRLPQECQLWAGGKGVERLTRKPRGVRVVTDLQVLGKLLAAV